MKKHHIVVYCVLVILLHVLTVITGIIVDLPVIFVAHISILSTSLLFYEVIVDQFGAAARLKPPQPPRINMDVLREGWVYYSCKREMLLL